MKRQETKENILQKLAFDPSRDKITSETVSFEKLSIFDKRAKESRAFFEKNGVPERLIKLQGEKRAKHS